jgi:replicative DNA helicase
MNVAMAAARKGTVLVVSPEMAAGELALREIIRYSRVMKWARRPWNKRPETERDDAARRHTLAASTLLAEDPPIAFLDQPSITMVEIEHAAETLRKDRGRLSLVIVDYAQEVADTDPRTPRYLTVGAVGSRSIALAAEQACAVIVASQVNVVREGNEETFAMRESAILKHKCHFALELAVEWEKRSDGSRTVGGAKIRCTKARNGPAFELPLSYRPELYLISDGAEAQ